MRRVLPDRFDTARLILRPIAAADAPSIFAAYAQDPEVVRFVIWRPHRTLADTEAYINGCILERSDQSRSYVLIARTDGQLLGAFALRQPQAHRLDCAATSWPAPIGDAA